MLFPFILKCCAKAKPAVADFHADTKTSSVPEPEQVRERSLSLNQAIPLPDRSPEQAKTTSFIAPAQRQPWRRWEDGYAVQIEHRRVKDFNFEARILTVHGKGKKDRTVPLPETIVPQLTSQLEVVNKIHDEDLAAGYAGVFLDDRLEKKYPSAAKDFAWQWFFPQKTLTQISVDSAICRGIIRCIDPPAR